MDHSKETTGSLREKFVQRQLKRRLLITPQYDVVRDIARSGSVYDWSDRISIKTSNTPAENGQTEVERYHSYGLPLEVPTGLKRPSMRQFRRKKFISERRGQLPVKRVAVNTVVYGNNFLPSPKLPFIHRLPTPSTAINGKFKHGMTSRYSTQQGSTTTAKDTQHKESDDEGITLGNLLQENQKHVPWFQKQRSDETKKNISEIKPYDLLVDTPQKSTTSLANILGKCQPPQFTNSTEKKETDGNEEKKIGSEVMREIDGLKLPADLEVEIIDSGPEDSNDSESDLEEFPEETVGMVAEFFGLENK